MQRFHKKYGSVPESVREVRQDIVNFACICGFSDREISEITVATGEASTNAIEHGHVPESAVELECWFESDELWISIEDAGGGLATGEKTWTRAVRKHGQGGYGLLIMKAFMDDVDLGTLPGGGARLTMRRRRTSAEQDARLQNTGLDN
jgi:anti-sigma regulatory factor (Ser/Thr protein kinase)